MAFNSLRYRLIFTVVAIETVMLLILVWSYSVETRRTHEERLNDTAQIVLDQFAATAGRFLLAVDYPSLAEYARSVIKHEELAYIVVKDSGNRTILQLGRANTPSTNGERPDASPILEARSDVTLAGAKQGEITLGFSRDLVDDAVAHSRRQGLLIAGAEIALSVVAALLIGFALTRNLSSLVTAAERFGHGETDVVTPVRGRDEVSAVAEAFNRMVIERGRAEERLRISEHRFRTVAEATPVPIGIARFSDGEVLYANPRVGPAFGLSEEAMVGRRMADFYEDPGDRAALQEEIGRDGMIREREMYFRRDDGERLIMLLNANVMAMDGEDVIVFGLYDVTEQKRTQQQLVQAQKMEAVGQLTGGIAHDFNNLLAVILGNLELIQGAGLTDEAEKRVQTAARAALAGAKLTQHLLAFSRQQSLNPDVVDVDNLIGEMIDLLGRTLGETIRIETVVAPDVWPVLVDSGQVANAIVNLAVNARDAMPDGGILTIKAENAVLGAETVRRYPDVAPGEYVKIGVTDNGAGMTPEVAAQVFEPFYTTKDVGKGSGLGLSMVYGFVKQSRGHVTLDSVPGEGTMIAMYLPRTEALPVKETQIVKKLPTVRGETILVVEDDPLVRESNVSILEELGYRVHEAADGRAALDVLARVPEIDLLFTDVVMPGGMSGVELARRAGKIRPGLRTLFTSGYPVGSAGQPHAGVAESGMIVKPFRIAELAARLREALDGS